MSRRRRAILAAVLAPLIALTLSTPAQAYTTQKFYDAHIPVNGSATSVQGTHAGGNGTVFAFGNGNTRIIALQGSGTVGGYAQGSANGTIVSFDLRGNYTNTRIQCRWLDATGTTTRVMECSRWIS